MFYTHPAGLLESLEDRKELNDVLGDTETVGAAGSNAAPTGHYIPPKTVAKIRHERIKETITVKPKQTIRLKPLKHLETQMIERLDRLRRMHWVETQRNNIQRIHELNGQIAELKYSIRALQNCVNTDLQKTEEQKVS